MAQTPDITPLLRLLEEARQAGRLTQAVAGARALSQLQPENLKARVVLARALFNAGLWQEAWEAYEVRFALMPEHFVKVMRRGPTGPEPIPFWRGDTLPEALLVMGEQGLGDTIQFARFLPMLRDRGVRVHAIRHIDALSLQSGGWIGVQCRREVRLIEQVTAAVDQAENIDIISPVGAHDDVVGGREAINPSLNPSTEQVISSCRACAAPR